MFRMERRRSEIRRLRLGRRGICPFCHWIGPPLLCACVGELYRELATMTELAPTVDRDGTALRALVRHEHRIRVLNNELAEERAS